MNLQPGLAIPFLITLHYSFLISSFVMNHPLKWVLLINSWLVDGIKLKLAWIHHLCRPGFMQKKNNNLLLVMRYSTSLQPWTPHPTSSFTSFLVPRKPLPSGFRHLSCFWDGWKRSENEVGRCFKVMSSFLKLLGVRRCFKTLSDFLNRQVQQYFILKYYWIY